MIIYKATNLINGKVYVGKTIGILSDRKSKHLSDAKSNNYKSIFHDAIRKYGQENFKWEIIDRGLFIELESYWIKKLNCKAPHGYNLTNGGDGLSGLPFTPEHCARISAAQKGKMISIEQRIKISLANKGRKHSLETRRKMSMAQSKRGKLPIETRTKISMALKGNLWNLGRKHSSQAKANMAASQIGNKKALGNKNTFGKKISTEHIAKLRAGHATYWVNRRTLLEQST